MSASEIGAAQEIRSAASPKFNNTSARPMPADHAPVKPQITPFTNLMIGAEINPRRMMSFDTETSGA
jgi:hypothetical protein